MVVTVNRQGQMMIVDTTGNKFFPPFLKWRECPIVPALPMVKVRARHFEQMAGRWSFLIPTRTLRTMQVHQVRGNSSKVIDDDYSLLLIHVVALVAPIPSCNLTNNNTIPPKHWLFFLLYAARAV